ncbi:MAG: hypothetical protein QOE65_2027 [Solirubrobacteraceae bacterium]|jgi:hypothetical protein|nr:hypothetical protein [Solirubrobacteraceae bacterium]
MTFHFLYREIPIRRLQRWLEKLARTAWRAMQAIQVRIRDLRREITELQPMFEEAKRKATQVGNLRWGNPVVTVLVMVLGGVIGGFAAWPYLDHQGLPTPMTLLADVFIACAEVGVAAALGRAVAALILDRQGTPFELSSQQRSSFVVQAVAWALVTLCASAFFASKRGDMGLWLIAGLMGSSLAVLGGMGTYESQFHRAARELGGRLRKLQARLDGWEAALAALERAVMATGRNLRGYAQEIVHRADIAFQRAWARFQRGVPLPDAPAVPWPSDAELVDLLCNPLRPGADAAGDPTDGPDDTDEDGGGAVPLRPRGPGPISPSASALPDGYVDYAALPRSGTSPHHT